jgi:hypothetical protein
LINYETTFNTDWTGLLAEADKLRRALGALDSGQSKKPSTAPNGSRAARSRRRTPTAPPRGRAAASRTTASTTSP